jgi:hypothetical protein
LLEEQTELCKLAIKYGSDKVPEILHSYTPVYYNLFKNKRNLKKVLEIGIGYPELMSLRKDYVTGASLYMWRDFFPEATIYGADIREDTLINEDRIKSFYVDQSDEGSLKNLVAQIGEDFDFILDDGSHIPEHQILTAKVLTQYLKSDGLYIIEDVVNTELVLNALSEFKTEVIVGNLKFNNELDRLILIRR